MDADRIDSDNFCEASGQGGHAPQHGNELGFDIPESMPPPPANANERGRIP